MRSLRYAKAVRRGNLIHVYYRAPGGKLHPLGSAPADADWTEDPDITTAWAEQHRQWRSAGEARRGDTLAALEGVYLRSPGFKRLAKATQDWMRPVLRRIVEKGRAVPIASIEPRHVQNDIDKFAPQSARNRLKVWRAALDLAQAKGWIKENPARAVKLPKAKSKPHRAWTAEDVARFRERWPIGTQQRLALELLYWTGARRADLVQLGPRNVWSGRMIWDQSKTGSQANVGIPPELAQALASAGDCETFLQTRDGSARTVKGFGEWFARACKAAGVSARAHGMRHTIGTEAAEEGMSAHQIGALLGHDGPTEAQTYTQQTNRRRMADDAMDALKRARLETPPAKSGNTGKKP